MLATDWIALVIGIALVIRWRSHVANMNGTDCDYESGERPVQAMPDYSRGWTAKERECHRLEAESARWQVERQQDEILRMYNVCALDAEEIEALKAENKRLKAENNDLRATLPAREGEAA